MKNYIIDAYKALGVMLLALITTTIFGSPFIMGLVLGVVVNHNWLWLTTGTIITLPIEIALIRWLVERDYI